MSVSIDVCRLCLGERPTHNIYGSNLSLHRKIQVCCGLQMSANDGLPELICSTCAETVDGIASFRLKCESNDRLLKRKLAATVEIETDFKSEVKDEPDSDSEYAFEPDDSIMNPQVTIVESKTVYKFGEDTLVFQEFCQKTEASTIGRRAGDRTRSSGGRVKKKPPKKPDVKKFRGASKSPDKNKDKKYDGVCPFCGAGDFDSPGKYYVHLKTHNERPFECDICNKSFKSKVHLIPHLRTHLDKDYFQCDICGKLFNSARYTRRHVEEVHNDANVVECNICGKIVKPTSLKGHLKSHKGEKKYECDVCKQKFISKTGVLSHMRIHTGEKPYGCRFCESKFTIERTLRDHERLHTGETPYHCPVCDKGFIQLSNMKSHFRNNHKGVEFNYKRKKSTKYGSMVV